jgi:HEAT repeat protein
LASKKLEERIEQLRQLGTCTPDAAVVATLRKALADKSNLIVAAAAKTIAELHVSDLIPDLLAAFERFFEEPVKADPKCWGKTAIVKGLTQLDYDGSAPFLRGARHIQMEPVYGGQEDSAPQLRADSLLALVQCADLRRFHILEHLVDAMSDPADMVRIEAVRALTQLDGDEAVLLLRLKARLGDRRPLIVGHVFDALLTLQPQPAVAFVAEYLNSSDEELRDEAALALGASRLQSAAKVLMKTWEESRNEIFRGTLLRAISSSRLPEAIEFLLQVLKTGTARESAAATEALKLHAHSAEIQALIAAAKKA